jgi:glycine cleavage system pyridoxal-binding protein P
MIDGFGGTFVEAHALDPKLAKKIPKRMIGRTLTLDGAAALLDRLV